MLIILLIATSDTTLSDHLEVRCSLKPEFLTEQRISWQSSREI